MAMEPRRFWPLVARCAAVLICLLDILILWPVLKGVPSIIHHHWEWIELLWLILGPLLIAMNSVFLWIAWRLWFRWNSSTVRLGIGLALAMAIIICASQISAHSTFLGNISQVLLLILAAILYRKLSQRIIMRAQLEDPKDVYGQPIGRVERGRQFGRLLGFIIWLSGGEILIPKHVTGNRPGWLEVAAFLGPIVFGCLAYKIVVWMVTPRVELALPPGAGFEVLPIRAKDQDVAKSPIVQ